MSNHRTEKTRRIRSLLSISHDKDVDGLTSAAIVWRYAMAHGLDHEVILTDYGSFEPVFSTVATRRNTLVVVTDLGMEDNSVDTVVQLLERAVAQGCRVVWLDHHQWTPTAIKKVLSLGNRPVLKVNHDYCAAEIAFRVLMPRDAVSEELARVAHDSDFNLREIEAANALTDALSVIRFGVVDRGEDMTSALLPLLSKLAHGGLDGVWDREKDCFKDPVLEERVKYYRKEKAKRMRKALLGHCDHTVHGRLVRIVELPRGVTTTDMGTFLCDPENLKVDGKSLPVADLVITLGQGGKLGFRRGNESVLCNMVAKLFNGGGHEYAAGGEYGSYEDFEAVCDDIFVTLSKDMSWVAPSAGGDSAGADS